MKKYSSNLNQNAMSIRERISDAHEFPIRYQVVSDLEYFVDITRRTRRVIYQVVLNGHCLRNQ